MGADGRRTAECILGPEFALCAANGGDSVRGQGPICRGQREKRSELIRPWARTTSIRGSPTKVGDGCGSLQGKKTLAVVALVTTH